MYQVQYTVNGVKFAEILPGFEKPASRVIINIKGINVKYLLLSLFLIPQEKNA
jgi:hypothetical protein